MGLTFWIADSLVHTEIAGSQKLGSIQPHERQTSHGLACALPDPSFLNMPSRLASP